SEVTPPEPGSIRFGKGTRPSAASVCLCLWASSDGDSGVWWFEGCLDSGPGADDGLPFGSSFTVGASPSPFIRGRLSAPPGTRSRARLVTLLRKSGFFGAASERLGGSSEQYCGCFVSRVSGGSTSRTATGLRTSVGPEATSGRQ